MPSKRWSVLPCSHTLATARCRTQRTRGQRRLGLRAQGSVAQAPGAHAVSLSLSPNQGGGRLPQRMKPRAGVHSSGPGGNEQSSVPGGSPGRQSSGLRTRHHAPGVGGASLTSCSLRYKMTTPLPGPCRTLWEIRLGSGSGPGPGSPDAARPVLASPPEAPDLRIFALVTVELSRFAPGQKAPAGPWCPGWRLCGCRRRRWRRLGLFVVHDQRAGTADCRLHLGCSTPPAQFADCSREAILA